MDASINISSIVLHKICFVTVGHLFNGLPARNSMATSRFGDHSFCFTSSDPLSSIKLLIILAPLFSERVIFGYLFMNFITGTKLSQDIKINLDNASEKRKIPLLTKGGSY